MAAANVLGGAFRDHHREVVAASEHVDDLDLFHRRLHPRRLFCVARGEHFLVRWQGVGHNLLLDIESRDRLGPDHSSHGNLGVPIAR